MAMVNFVTFIQDLAQELIVNNKTHKDFIIIARLLSDAIQHQLILNDSIFQHLLDKLHTTATYVKHLLLDMPLNFEIFLPVRIPVPVMCSFNEEHRTVQVTGFRTEHPFFFGNALSFKRMNLMLQQDLTEVVNEMSSISAYGVIYDLTYIVHCSHSVPFIHKLAATERGSNGEHCISFEFVLALVFESVNVPLPSYYNAPIVGQWLAYGMVAEEGSSTDWAVLVPKWKSAEPAVCLRSMGSQIMLYRLMKIQECQLYAQPYWLKLSFFMATEALGEKYQRISISDMMLMILYDQVIRNVYLTASEHTSGDKLLSIKKQQIRARGIFSILDDAAHSNLITSEFLFSFFSHMFIPAVPSC
ncbi:hypothetical protein KR059_001963, partial [Drosophila kikkawai]